MPATPKRFRWLKYLAVGLPVLIILALVFYQQIIFGIAQVVAQQVAKSQAFDLQFKIGGSIFSSLYIEDLHLQPLPGNTKLPVERVDARRIAFRYNLPALFKKDFPNVVDLIELKNVDVVVRPSSEPAPPQGQTKSSGLRIPAVIPKKIEIQDVNLLVRTPTGNLEVKNFALEFQQGGEGYLACEAVHVPGVGAWDHLHGGLTDRQNKLALTDFALPPLLDLHRLQIDLSGSEQGKYGFAVDAHALGASIAAYASYLQPADKPSVDATVSLLGLDLVQLQNLAPIPVSGSVPKIEVHLNGELDRPTSLSGSISADANAIKFQNYLIDTVRLSIFVDHGKGEIRELSVDAGANQARAAGGFTLAGDAKYLLTRSTANIGVAVSVAEPERFVPGLKAASLASGTIGLVNGRAQALFAESVSDIAMSNFLPGLSLSRVDSLLLAVARLPLNSDIWSSVAAVVSGKCSNIQYQDARIDAMRLSCAMTDGINVTSAANVASGTSQIEVSAKVPLPTPEAPIDPKQISAQVRFNVVSIADFIRQNEVEGTLTANGDVRVDHLQVGGTVRAAGDQLKYRGVTLQSLGLDTVIKENTAQVQNFRLALDPNNFLQLSGSAGLMDPFPFNVDGGLVFKDLGVLNAIFENFGIKPGISGQLTTNFTGSGDIHRPSAKVRVAGGQIQYRGIPVQNIDLQAKVENSLATIEAGRISLNDSNNFDLTGEAGLTDPFPFKVDGGLVFKDLGVLNAIFENFGIKPGISGQLTTNFTGSGDIHRPSAKVRVAGGQIQYRGIPVQNIDLQAKVENSLATIEAGRISLNDSNNFDLTGEAGLTDPFPFKVDGGLVFKDLGVLNAIFENFGIKPGISGQLTTNFTGSGDIHRPSAKVRVAGGQIQYRGIPVQNIDLQAKVENSLATIEAARISLDDSNNVDLTGEADLIEPYSYKTTGAIDLNDLGVFKQMLVTAGQAPLASGNIHANWSFAGDAKKALPDGTVHVDGSQVNYRGLLVRTIQIEANLLNQKLELPTCKITFNKDNFIDANGNALLQEPYDYYSNATIQFQDVGFLNEAIKSFGQDLGLGGKLNLSWQGNGPVKSQTGTFELHGDNLHTKTVQSTKIDLTGSYQGSSVGIPQFQVASPYADVDASILLSPQAFQIPKLSIRRSGNTIAGNIKIPLNLQSGQKVDLDQPVTIDIGGDKISLASFQTGKPQVTGTVGFRIQASQTLRDPLVQLTANARDIKLAGVSKLSAANGDFSVRIADKMLTTNCKITQPDIQPWSVTGKMPLDLGQIIQSGTVPDTTPLQFAVNWPATNLAFLRKLVPDIKVIEGSAGANVMVNGTIKRPDLTGAIRANLARFQAKTDTVPPISEFAANISFRRDHITIDQLRGLAGGGSFGAGGGIDLTDGTNPKFDIMLNGKQVLLTRSDGIIVRANLDMAVRGMLSAGQIDGTVGITNSRFFKDIDILPLNLPGRPPAQPPAGAMPKIAIDTPPFKDWKFNIAIRTDNPFLVQSNLARGRVSVNLQAGGTGSAPTVTGAVRIDRLVANLPFSKMEIDGGTINFVQGANILDPSLSIVGRSTVSDYDVRARIFGNVSNPTVLLDSSPPLSQGDILVLLATGSPTSTYAQDPSLLAGRATFIVLQQIYKKFFPSTNRAEESKEPFIDRFSVNVTPGDRAGEQNIVSTFKLTNNWQIIGDFGTTSYQGRLKYLIRFR